MPEPSMAAAVGRESEAGSSAGKSLVAMRGAASSEAGAVCATAGAAAT
jgi:hypothetical protein